MLPGTVTNTLRALWSEWTVPNYSPGRPSIREMDELHGEGTWVNRKIVPGALRFWQTRKAIIDEVTSSPVYVASSPEAALQSVEQKMNGASLNNYGRGLITIRNAVIQSAKEPANNQVSQ
jgi:hypothetical protein